MIGHGHHLSRLGDNETSSYQPLISKWVNLDSTSTHLFWNKHMKLGELSLLTLACLLVCGEILMNWNNLWVGMSGAEVRNLSDPRIRSPVLRVGTYKYRALSVKIMKTYREIYKSKALRQNQVGIKVKQLNFPTLLVFANNHHVRRYLSIVSLSGDGFDIRIYRSTSTITCPLSSPI